MPRRETERKRAPASTPEGRENRMVSYALDLAEKQLRDGTATSQVIVHFLKSGSQRDELERERLRNENLLAQAKIEAMQSSQRMEEVYTQALNAMRTYSGQEPDVDDDEYD